jgi:hypothetical protein
VTVYWNDSDIVGMMSDSPNVISATPDGGEAVVGKCLFYESDELKLDAPESAGLTMHLARAYVQTSLYGFVDGGSAVIIDGANYTVWKRLMEGDGAITQLLLRVAGA